MGYAAACEPSSGVFYSALLIGFADKVFSRVWGRHLTEEARQSWGRLLAEADLSRAFPFVARREHLLVWP